MIGLGYRREMRQWDMAQVQADFYEVAPENWLRRDRTPLHDLRAAGKPVYLHGVSLNLGGQAPLNTAFLREVRVLMHELECPFYSDHLACSGDAHQLYDLFPVPLTQAEVLRISDRIALAQDVLGCLLAVENTTWYTNVGDMPEAEFLMRVVERAGCQLLLDLNNIEVNRKNHGTAPLRDFVRQLDLGRVSYLHVAGHEFDTRFGMYLDTHSQPASAPVAQLAQDIAEACGLPILLEWDNDVPDLDTINRELACLQPSLTT